MKALIIYESIFGNNKAVAEAIADGLAPVWDVTVTEVASAPTEIPDDVLLLIVGGPTHQFGMSRPSSRDIVASNPERSPDASTTGIREWLDRRPKGHQGLMSASFGTGMAKPRFIHYFGSAAKRISKRLKQLQFDVIDSPQTFWVDGLSGPLVDGEAERAREWGESLGARSGQHAREPMLVSQVRSEAH